MKSAPRNAKNSPEVEPGHNSGDKASTQVTKSKLEWEMEVVNPEVPDLSLVAKNRETLSAKPTAFACPAWSLPRSEE